MNLTVLPLPAVPDRTAPDRTTADPTRWRPERAGIVNVWRYYDETFSFHRGRLLLRGPNGTGKSKALELLLPFLLDASLRPSRLSTFGGQERTMHWNLMGGGYDGKTRSGYVWVEFARAGEGDREWFTLGARLQASVNTRGVTAGYFTTRQRVNLPGGLALLGEGSRPLTRGALAEAIGPHGRVFDAAGDYRREVMHTLFRGFDADQYEALVFALLQLRTPKLSEHLDPDELSTLLSRSLPPLDRQAVAEIAEGFERLDRSREDLAQLELDVAAATRLADRQRRYAQRVVRAAAADLIGATTRMDDVTRRARHSRERHDAAVDAQRGLEDADRRLDAEALDKDARRQALQDSDAYRQGAELDRLRQEAERQRRQAATARRQADQAAAHVAEDHGRVEHAARDVQHLDAARERAAGELRRAATRAGLEAVWEEAAGADPDQARRLLDAAGDARDHQVAEVRDALAGHQRAVVERDAAAGRLERGSEELEAARTTSADRRRDRDAAADGLSAAVRDWAAGCAQLALADRAQRLAGLVEDESAILALVHAAAQEVTAAVADREAQIRARGRALSAEREQLADEHARLQAIRDLAPPPPPTRTADRAGRSGAPLWRLVAFADGVDEPTQAALEAALEDTGLVDAWVAPDGSVAADDGARPLRQRRADHPDRRRQPRGRARLRPDGAVPAAQVRRLLRAVAWGPTAPEHTAAVGADGRWRLATLVGSWSKPLAEFIGATARERARQRRLADLAARILELEAALAAVAAELEDCGARRIRVAAELDGRPSHAPLRRADEALARAETTVTIRADAVSAARDEHERAERQVGAGLRRLTALASMHRLPTDAPGLDRVGGCSAWLPGNLPGVAGSAPAPPRRRPAPRRRRGGAGPLAGDRMPGRSGRRGRGARRPRGRRAAADP